MRCTTAHPFYTRFTNIFSAFVSKATVRPNPKVVANNRQLAATASALAGAERAGGGRRRRVLTKRLTGGAAAAPKRVHFGDEV